MVDETFHEYMLKIFEIMIEFRLFFLPIQLFYSLDKQFLY